MTKTNKRRIATIVSLVLIVCIAVGATLAWLTDTTSSIENTFTVGKVDIDLTEESPEGQTAKMIPGSDITKDPKITVKAGSEACYVYVKIEKTNNPDTYLTYSIADGWNALTGVDGVYYRECAAVTADTDFPILANNKVTVKSDLTSAQMATAGENNPKLKFTGYAIQSENIADAAAGWTALQSA